MKTIEELKNENVPYAQFDDFFTLENSNNEEQKATKETIQEYLNNFVRSEKCICCGTTQGGLFGSLLGGFQFGIAYGEGECGTCGYPARTHHVIKDQEGNEVCTINNFIMQYHPSVLEVE